MNRVLYCSIYVVRILALCIFFNSTGINSRAAQPKTLTLYCAAGIRYAVEDVIKDYKKEYGVEVQPIWAGSGALISIMDVARKGDLYLAADQDHINIARQKGLVREAMPIAYQRPVIAVRKGNPKKIKTLSDLAREDVVVSLANQTAAVGRASVALLQKFNLWDKVKTRVDKNGVYKPTVNEVANDLLLGMVDVGLIWDSTVLQYSQQLEMIAIPQTDDFIDQVTIGVLSFSRTPTEALKFARYLSARDRGLKRFAEKQWPTIEDGDAWAEKPQITYFAGGVNRRAIEETLKEFAERENVLFNTVYNGCGILVGQMKLGQRPDVYHSCDASFMADVTDLFFDVKAVSSMNIVIIVAPAFKDRIKSVDDLLKPGIKVGMGNPQQSAMGHLTVKMLQEMGKWDKLQKSGNIAVQVPTGEFLVAPILTGNLDAALCYESNATLVTQKGDAAIVPIDHSGAVAVQTYTIGKQSKHKYLLQRFLAALEHTEDRYKKAGFEFKLNEPSDQ